MKISLISREKFRIFLNENEFYLLFGADPKSSATSQKFHREIKKLIMASAPESTFFEDCEKINISVFKIENGINIEVTKSIDDGIVNRRLYPVLNWRLDFFDADSMLEAFYTLYVSNIKDSNYNALYRTQNGYSAKIHATIKTIDTLRPFCYANRSDREIFELEEYGFLISNNKIIEKIGSAIAKIKNG